MDAKKILIFIQETEAFKMLPEYYLKIAKNNMISKQWKVYKFKARVDNDEGWEADQTIDGGEILAVYCWTGMDEYCITSQDCFNNFVSSTYKSVGKCVFPLENTN